MDFILDDETNNIINPITNDLWNNLMYNIMIYGYDYELLNDDIKFFNDLFCIKIINTNVRSVYYEIFYKLKFSYNNIYKKKSTDEFIIIPKGLFSKYTLETSIITAKSDIFFYNFILNNT